MDYFIFDIDGADAGTLYWDVTCGSGADAAVARLIRVTLPLALALRIL